MVDPARFEIEHDGDEYPAFRRLVDGAQLRRE
jgi:hypothetical protein